jgi:hypothetical protein
MVMLATSSLSMILALHRCSTTAAMTIGASAVCSQPLLACSQPPAGRSAVVSSSLLVPFAGLSAQATANFRAVLSPAEIAQMAIARNLFHASWAVPLILYALTEKRPRLFPMSISWTIRRGVPRLLNNALWTAGWTILLATVIQATGGFGAIPRFVAQMFATGALATILCPLGSGKRLQDAVHWVAALVYMVDHVVMFGVLGMKRGFLAAFLACFALMAACQPATKPDAERVLARQSGEDGSNHRARGENEAAEWGFMVGEYGLFVSFLCGMLSGVR